jgi:hypothetical protein
MTRATPTLASLLPVLLAANTACAAEPAAPSQPAPAPDAAPATAAPPLVEGHDFIAQAKLLYRVVSCGGSDPLPSHLDAKIVDQHCKALEPKIKSYREKYVGGAKAFIAGLRPANLPTTVVYPFGGGDLISVLTTFPDATDITTLSLEHAGDPRRLDKISSARLAESLLAVRRTSWGLLMADNSTTENLQALQRGEIPGELAFFLVALVVHGYEPVSMRFFNLNPDGTLHYLSEEDIAKDETTLAKTLRGAWAPPDSSVAFSNVELTFRPVGAGPQDPVRVHRHFGANLADQGFEKNPALMKYLEAKGRISAMTKAASYLLWREDFSKMRDYLTSHMDFMISDSTGIPPQFLQKAGFALETYGTFVESFLSASAEYNKQFRQLWKSQPKRSLAFRYGYIDASRSFHMFVARKVDPGAAATATP